jgi:hypothetical protein
MIDALIKRVSVTYKCYEMYAHPQGLGASEKKKKILYNTKVQGGELTCSHFF